MRRKYLSLSLLSVLFIALNSRSSISVVGTMSNLIMDEYNIGATLFGLLAGLPLVSFSVFALVAPAFSINRGIVLALILILFGVTIRSFFGVTLLFIGTILVGMGIAILNVHLPSFIKTKKFNNPSKVMAIYSTMLGISVLLGISGRYAVFIWGVRGSLFCFAFFALLALYIFLPFLKNKRYLRKEKRGNLKDFYGILRNKNAWIITVFMGTQSCVFYTTIAWFSAIVEGKLGAGLSGTNFTLTMQLIAIVSAYVIPIGFTKSRNKGVYIVMFCSLSVIGFLFLIFVSSFIGILISTIFLSITIASTLGVVLIMIANKTKDAQEAIYLNSMAQFFGYLVASLGPFIFGLLSDVTGSFVFGIIFIDCVAMLVLISGVLSNRINRI